MILAIDIGNTNIVIGCTQEDQVHFVESVHQYFQDRAGVCGGV